MKRIFMYVAGVAVLSTVLIACEKERISVANQDADERIGVESELPTITFEKGTPIPGQYIVVLDNNTISSSRANLTLSDSKRMVNDIAKDLFAKQSMAEKHVTRTFAHALTGFVTNLTDEEVKLLRRDNRVKYIEQDQVIAMKKPDNPGGGKGGGNDGGGDPDPQITPWGITAVGGFGNGAETGKKAWIIDSGIDLDHPDLNVDVANSMSFLGGNQANNPDDQNGHGSHVAGTVGALDNNIGVVGVAAGVPVVSVRVLDRRGNGSISGVIAGVNYVAATASSW